MKAQELQEQGQLLAAGAATQQPRLQFRNWIPELPLPLALTYLGHGGGSQCIYTPLSASTSSKKLIPSWRLRQHARAREGCLGASRRTGNGRARKTAKCRPVVECGNDVAAAYSGWF